MVAPGSAAAHRAFEALGGTFAQVGIVTPDIEGALRAHAAMGPWSVWTYDRDFVPDLQAEGRPGDFAMRLALNTSTPQLELIEPLDDRSPYAQWMARGGPGLHHLGFVVEDVHATTEAMRRAGFAVIASGSGYGLDGDGGFCYYDTVDAIGYVTEAIERPARRREPEVVVR